MLALAEMWPQGEDETEPSPQLQPLPSQAAGKDPGPREGSGGSADPPPERASGDRPGDRPGDRSGNRSGEGAGESGERPGRKTPADQQGSRRGRKSRGPAGARPEHVESEQYAAVRRTRIGDAPEQFIWRGRLYLVRSVIEHDPGRVERWQVAAAAGAFMPTGVFSLEFDWTSGTWAVYRLPDEEWERLLGRDDTSRSEGEPGGREPGETER
jgi:hypothetical protein